MKLCGLLVALLNILTMLYYISGCKGIVVCSPVSVSTWIRQFDTDHLQLDGDHQPHQSLMLG